MDIEPGFYHLKIRKGKTLRKVFTFKVDGSPVNLTGYTAKAQVRSTPESSIALVEMATGDSSILLGGILGTITLVKSAGFTATLDQTNAVWELELTEPSGDVMSLLYGPCTIFPEVVV